jgi:hypothetical protein
VLGGRTLAASSRARSTARLPPLLARREFLPALHSESDANADSLSW